MIITNILLVAVLVAILVSIALIIHQNKKTSENKDLFNESISKDDLAKVENKVGDESIRLNEKMLKIEGGLTKEFLSLKGDVKKDFSLSMTQFNERLSSFDKSLNFLKESQDNFNKILGGVKQYGTLSERGLKAIVSDILPNSMFVENAKLNPETKDFVEIAIKLPSNVLLPVDSHWPQERYKDVISAYNENDKEKQKITQKMLADAMKKKASEVKEKYINPPYSTPFAYVYVPAESLYNILVNYSDSKTGLNFIQQLQKDFSVTIVGPNTLHQSIQILSMGFET